MIALSCLNRKRTTGDGATSSLRCLAIVVVGVVALVPGCTTTVPTTTVPTSIPAGTIADVQTKAAAFVTGESMEVTGLMGIRRGDGLVVAIFAESGQGSGAYPTVTAVSGGGVTFTKAATYQLEPFPYFTMELWVGTDSSGGQTTVTAQLAGGALADGALFVGEFSGLASSPYDRSATNAGTADVTTYTTPSVAPSEPGELFWAVGRWPNVKGTSPNSPWSGLISGVDSSLVSLDTIASGSSAQQGSWTNDGEAAEEVTLVACFKPSTP